MGAIPHPTHSKQQEPALSGITSAALATTIVLWASAFVAIRAALPAYGPAHLAVVRFLVASAALALYAVATRMRLPAARDLPRIALCGILGITVYHLALNAGEQTVTAGAASMIVNTGPIWTALLAGLVLGEQVRRRAWIGIAVSFTGALAIAAGEAGGLGISAGAGLVLLAAIVQSAYAVLQKPLLARYRATEVATYSIWAGTLGLLPFAPGLDTTLQAAPLDTTLAVVFLGIGPGALAYVTWSAALARLPAARAASFLYSVPPVALLVAWLWLGETLGPLSLVGGALALGGVFIATRSRPYS